MPEAPTSSLGVWFARVDAADYRICRKLNHGAAFPIARRLFQIASRLGDGIIWFVLLVALPCVYGRQALRPAVVMAVTGVLGLVAYKVLKRAFVRERPFITHAAIDLAMPPLDRYSFPSGHTLHAVSFALQASMHFPQLAWGLIPLALTIAASRVVLGLHYPTDVLAGAVLGASLGALGLSLS
ncbi:MAG TPA: phosphatase PAP2 family protein [Steroidobacteraceae bacterium]